MGPQWKVLEVDRLTRVDGPTTPLRHTVSPIVQETSVGTTQILYPKRWLFDTRRTLHVIKEVDNFPLLLGYSVHDNTPNLLNSKNLANLITDRVSVTINKIHEQFILRRSESKDGIPFPHPTTEDGKNFEKGVFHSRVYDPSRFNVSRCCFYTIKGILLKRIYLTISVWVFDFTFESLSP